MGFPGYAGWIVTLDPDEVALNRIPLDLNDGAITIGGTGGGTGIDWGTAALTQFMSQQGQWGNAPADFVAPNRTITIPLGLGMVLNGIDPETALRNLSMKVALIQQQGGWLKRQRAGGKPLYADIVDATIDIPDDWLETGGVEPGVTLVLTCAPDFYGDELTLDTLHCTGFCSGVLTSGGVPAVIAGDYPARCRLAVTETGGNEQDWMAWGLRSRYYDPAATAQLAFTGANLAVLDSGTSVTLSGAYTGHAIRSPSLSTSVATDYVTIGPALQTHIGTYRVLARCYSSSGVATVQLTWWTWDSISAPTTTNAGAPMAELPTTFQILDLGLIRLEPSPAGATSWSGTLSALGSGTVATDLVLLVPVDDGAGSSDNYTPGIFPAHSTTQIRSEGMWCAGSHGFENNVSGAFVGDLPRLPMSGSEQRPVQVLVKPAAGEGLPAPAWDDNNIDTFTVTPYYRPCYLSRI